MRRFFIIVYLLFISTLSYAQQSATILVMGRIPYAPETGLYQIQVGAFRNAQYAQVASEKLIRISFNPSYESYMNFTRVLIKGIPATDVQSYITRIRDAGFTTAIVRPDTGTSEMRK